MSAKNEKLVTDFCMGLSGPLAAALAPLAEDVDYWNIPMQPVKGRDAARKVLEPFLGEGSHLLEKMEIRHTASSGNVVMNERLETWAKADVRIQLPVSGVFEIEGGKIRKWRDYFDLATLNPLVEAVAGKR
jgi:limonene-1,2-epoxide hydrolase